jgi:hypothetical protein
MSAGMVRAQSEPPFVFTVLGPTGVIARVITDDTACPEITVDGATSAMQLRAGPEANYPNTVCEAAIPPAATSASVLGQPLKLAKAQPERVVVLGDTGCRMKGETMQSCNDPTQWPFAPLAASAAQSNPDLIIHVGDYHYRESPCIVDKANCAGSPFGFNWASWNADFFTPARPLLASAPWVMLRGNHEDCSRAGGGYFRMLDPRPLSAACPTYTDPYALDYMDPQLIVVDNSAVNDFEIEPDQLAEYTRQAEMINQMARGTTWLLLHDPLYVFGHLGVQDGKETLFIDQLTMQAAFNNTYPPSVQVIMGGHIHLFQVLSFGEGRPPSLVVGNSGTLLDPAITTPLTGQETGGKAVAYGTMIDRFGFVAMDRAGDGWAMAVKNVDGGDMDKCVLGGGSLLCGQAAVPRVGGDFTAPSALWVMFAMVGSAVVLVGLALGVRSTMLKRA